MEGSEQTFKAGNADSFGLYGFEKEDSFGLVFDEDCYVIVVRAHEETMEIEEGIFASEQDDVEMRGIFYQFWD